ncbi:hypothetical protein [Candidatus Nitrosarchaeum limnium]|uniref:Uncharacterized protein n=2 Tax=Candidatus Nitrosarchaeum limnium TaxID=1007084 RepID=S2EPZ2_9ARCH|nr:hypothetical protein [Candidatus Nitrosarchaeum limnium]EGG41111.1 hypothetical protein Nlim_1918 [Candidatus Nitrosarchaeum limnium SFB1]EPA04539.1 hypothetical protein BG20_I0343 [Candidatus Nitrosarchaeum limnium BG20]
MVEKTKDLIDVFYDKEKVIKNTPISEQTIKKSAKAKYQIFDEAEFTRGREILGDLIVHGMIASGGTDIDWLIEHNGGFVILEFKGFHNDKINIAKGQIIAYEKLHEKLNQATKCYLYIIGCDDVDFLDPDSTVWIFEMKQWKTGAIPKNTIDIYGEDVGKQNKFIVYREYMEEINIEKLREIIDSHWKEFERIMP